MVTGSSILRLLPPVLLCLASLGIALTASGPDPNGMRAVLFPPWWSGQRVTVAAAAAGRLVGFGVVSFLVVIAPEPGARPISGALLQFPVSRAGFCGLASGL
jgi:hypothetical protein